ncbi:MULTISPECIES: hypothetical protein [Bacillaceae]|uniref:hypothetical protein n=1 Tax=Bacillaceae TaxID=186817 RepID=UPI000B32E7C0|nr:MULTISPECIES: hypothetical protein [Bacillaceae]MED4475702.1 hypothetical protein [Oceanobacillus caeni]
MNNIRKNQPCGGLVLVGLLAAIMSTGPAFVTTMKVEEIEVIRSASAKGDKRNRNINY